MSSRDGLGRGAVDTMVQASRASILYLLGANRSRGLDPHKTIVHTYIHLFAQYRTQVVVDARYRVITAYHNLKPASIHGCFRTSKAESLDLQFGLTLILNEGFGKDIPRRTQHKLLEQYTLKFVQSLG